eukprot:1424404-Pyramimonas_sp.AAC.1
MAVLEDEAAKYKRLNVEDGERSRAEISKMQEVIKATRLQLEETQNKFYEEVATNVCVKQDLEKLKADTTAKVTQLQRRGWLGGWCASLKHLNANCDTCLTLGVRAGVHGGGGGGGGGDEGGAGRGAVEADQDQGGAGDRYV